MINENVTAGEVIKRPKRIIDYADITQIPEVTDLDIALGSAFINGYMPTDPPKVDEKWHDLFAQVFYRGGQIEYDMKESLTKEDGTKYYRFIQSIMKSYGPKHQDKEAAVAYLYSVWLNDWKVADV